MFTHCDNEVDRVEEQGSVEFQLCIIIVLGALSSSLLVTQKIHRMSMGSSVNHCTPLCTKH